MIFGFLITLTIFVSSQQSSWADGGSVRPKIGDSPQLQSNEIPEKLQGVGIEERRGEIVPFEKILVRDEEGREIALNQAIHSRKPTILSLVYFTCKSLCNYHLNGLIEGLRDLEWSLGKEFNLIAVSFDAKETSAEANLKWDTFLKLYGREIPNKGMRFFTASESNIEILSKAVGFSFKWDDQQKEWIHKSAAILVTPEGKISKYLPGVLFEPNSLRLAIAEAGQGHIGGVMESLALLCYKYDPHSGKYVIASFRVMQAAAALTLLGLIFVFTRFWFKQKKLKAQKMY